MAAVQPWDIGKAFGFARPENTVGVFRKRKKIKKNVCLSFIYLS